jgi:hypothetical protein
MNVASMSLVRGELGFAPSLTPRALARALPSPVRADQLALELGEAAEHVSLKRPCGVVVSAHASPSDRKPACLFARVRVGRASRLSRVTIGTPPAANWSTPATLRALGLGSTRHLAEHVASVGGGQGGDLRFDALDDRAFRRPLPQSGPASAVVGLKKPGPAMLLRGKRRLHRPSTSACRAYIFCTQ